MVNKLYKQPLSGYLWHVYVRLEDSDNPPSDDLMQQLFDIWDELDAREQSEK